ncbi:MAG: BREX system ATP-binding domain-containing protein [Nitrolancea sp.]
MGSSSSPPWSPRNETAIVGRDREQATLRQALDDMLAGHGSLVLVSGEAGIGKTTLVEWLASEASTEGCLVIRGGCYDLTATPPYGPWIEALRTVPLGDQLPSIPSFVNDAEAFASLRGQEMLFATVATFLVQVATAFPVVVFLDDLHWSDQGTLEFLRVWSRSIRSQPILVVGTYRSSDVASHHLLDQVLPLLVREAQPERIALAPLDRQAIRAFITTHFALNDADNDRLIDWLSKRSDGNPFFLHELVRTLEDQQVLVPSGSGGWQISDLSQVRVPTLVRQVIDGRLNRLTGRARELLQIGAVLGQSVPVDLWRQVTETDNETLVDALKQGRAAHLLEETATGTAWQFRHALIRETLYEDLFSLQRRDWHRRIAEALAAMPSHDPDHVAHHFQQAADPRAVEWLIHAGERAQRSYAWPAAVERFETALKLLPEDASHARDRAWLLFRIGLFTRHDYHDRSIAHLEQATRLVASEGDDVLEALAYAHAGLVRVLNNEGRQGLHEMKAGVLTLEHLNEAQLQELAHIENALGANIGVQGRGTLILQMGEQGYFRQAEQMLKDRRDRGPVDEADANRATGTVWAYLGRPDLARQGYTQARRCWEALNVPVRAGAGADAAWDYIFVQMPYAADQLTRRQELAQLVHTLWSDETGCMMPSDQHQAVHALELIMSGNWTRATSMLDRVVAEFEFSFSPFHTSRLMLARYCGDRELVWSEIRRVMPAGPETQFGDHRYWVLDDLMRLAGAQALDDGDLILARSWLEAHDRLLAWSGAVLGQAENALSWSRYHALTGDLADARASAEQASVHASDPRQPLALIAVHRFLGNLDTAEKRFDAAETHLQESLRLADACAAPFERALTLLELADLRLAQRQSNESNTLLDKVQTICEPLGATPTLERVHALRQQIHQTAKKAPGYPGGLSTREVEVLQLVAEGLTDAEIAERLFISRRTVTSHMTSIFNKLGIGSRAAAAVWAKEHSVI